MLLLCLFAFLFSVQGAPQNEHRYLKENLMDKVHTFAKYMSNFQDVARDHERFRRDANDNNITVISVAINENFSEDIREHIYSILSHLEIEKSVHFSEIEFDEIDDVESGLVVIITETKENAKYCFFIDVEAEFEDDVLFVVTFHVNEECVKRTQWDSIIMPPEIQDWHKENARTGPTMLGYKHH